MRSALLSVSCAAILDVLSPPRCAACDAPLCAPGPFCGGCHDPVAPLFDELDAGVLVVASGRYAGSTARAITRFKYGSRPDLAHPLSDRIVAAAATANIEGPCVFVPVPLHPRRLARRGYNQSALLAARLARGFGWRLSARALERTVNTTEQATLSREQRLRNVEHAVVTREPLLGAHIALVDDVVTTGATALACARALRVAGAARVTILAVARATVEPAARASDADGVNS